MIEINNKTRSRIDLRLVKKVAERFLQTQGVKKSLSIAFVGDTVMRRLNRTYRGFDRPTDILSFAGADPGELGEIIIDFQAIKRQSRRYSKSIKTELIFILVHGLFHLIGFDDKTEKDRLKMIGMGENFIANNL